MSKLKPLFSKTLHEDTFYKDKPLSILSNTILSETTEYICNNKDKFDNAEILFRVPFELRAQTNFEMDFGWEYAHNLLVKQGNNYGDTRRFFILGVILESTNDNHYLIDKLEPRQGIFEVLNTSNKKDETIKQVIRNIDFAAKEQKNTVLGELGEMIVLDYEKECLIRVGKQDLSDKVSLTKDFLGNSAPYDILSFSTAGAKKFIEVKTTEDSFETPFFLSANELEFAKKNIKHYFLYRIYGLNRINKTAKMIVLKNIQEQCCFEISQYKAKIL